MSDVSQVKKKFVTVLDEPIKVYPYLSNRECTRTWKLNQYPLNEFILTCRNDGGNNYTSYFNLNIVGPEVCEMSVKITKNDFDPINGVKVFGLSEVKELEITYQKSFNWTFSTANNRYDEIFNGFSIRTFPFWLKVEYSVPKCSKFVLNGFKIDSNYITYIADFFNKPEFGDFQIKVEDQVFYVSKLALAAASPAFEAMFTANLSETKENSMEIKDFLPDVVKKMLQFCYNTEVAIGNNVEHAEQLVAIADKYQIEHLKDRAEQIVLKNLNIENAARLVVFADMHHCAQLRQACINLICANYAEFIKTKECEDLYKNFTKLAIEISGASAQRKESTSSPI